MTKQITIHDIGDYAIEKIIQYDNFATFYNNFPQHQDIISDNKKDELIKTMFLTGKGGLQFTCKRFYKLGLIYKKEIESIIINKIDQKHIIDVSIIINKYLIMLGVAPLTYQS